ncbi:hypothetical protein [Anaerofustis sp.]|uniref:hypothetical protein n=1 Tax=Anaerofustis sp. TaxID=1872517 RepID=UPI0025C24ED4|nr:hypothetical protein [Anaerofustis sp.]
MKEYALEKLIKSEQEDAVEYLCNKIFENEIVLDVPRLLCVLDLSVKGINKFTNIQAEDLRIIYHSIFLAFLTMMKNKDRRCN